MNSRITIDVNEDNQPIIKIEYNDSTDVRDKLVKKFLEGFGHHSTWAKFTYTPGPANKTATITPIEYNQLEEEANTMKVWVDYHNIG